jgi:hypothetical protein
VPACRVPYFAVLVSLLNNTSVQATEAIVLDCGRRLTAALAQADAPAAGLALPPSAVAKTLLRFECALAALGIVSCASVTAQLSALVSHASLCLTEAPAPRRAQPYTDFLVEGVLLALPWGGATLWDYDTTASEKLLAAVDDYIAARPVKVHAALVM